MTSLQIGISGIVALLLLLALRVPVAIALVTVSWFGLWSLLGLNAAWGILQSVPHEVTASWTLSAVPMFLLMGFIAYHAGFTNNLFELGKILFGRLPGSLAIASIIACSGFAAICGSSVACAAAMGRIAIPEMVRSGYDKNFACGTVAAGGTIGALIPPSILMIIYGVFTQTSILSLFLGGIGVGAITALSYMAVILLTSWYKPQTVPRSIPRQQRVSLISALITVWPVLLMVIIVFGGLFTGMFTSTEAGAVGAVLAIIIAGMQRNLTKSILFDSVKETVSSCAVLFIIIIGATMLTRFLSISGTGAFISNAVQGAELGYWQIFLIIVGIYLILGMFMDPLGAMLLTLPIFIPIVETRGLDLIWFGVLLTKLLEIGMVTPPFGLNVFVIKSVVGNLTSLAGVFRGVAVFLLADIVVVLMVLQWHDFVMAIPRLASGN